MEIKPIGQQGGLQKFLRIADVVSATGLSRASIYNKMQDGSFPVCIRLSTRAVAWRESDIAEWQASKAPKQAVPQ